MTESQWLLEYTFQREMGSTRPGRRQAHQAHSRNVTGTGAHHNKSLHPTAFGSGHKFKKSENTGKKSAEIG